MKRINTTLLEQMKISDIEITNRMNLLGITEDSLELLSSFKRLIENNVDEIVDLFYEKQTEIDEISLVIGDAETLARLRSAQRTYVIDLFSGNYDSHYVNNRLRIGLVHKRIGVEPKLYLSAIKTLKTIIKDILTNHIKDKDKDKDILNQTLDALDSLFYFDTTLVFDTYIDSLVSEIESAKNKTEIYARSLEEKVAERTRQLERLAKLDPLTNIYNQRAMLDVLRRELAASKRYDNKLSFVYFDIDNFKAINDDEGHLKGDEVLKSIGQILSDDIRESDLACRYGGDEFCLILPDCSTNNAKEVCEKIVHHFTEKYPSYSLSMGISEAGINMSVDELIRNTDEKMYLAKKEKGSYISI